MRIDELLLRAKERVSRNPEHQAVADYFELLRLDEDKARAQLLNKEVRELTAKMASGARNIDEAERFLWLHKRSLLFAAPVEFDAYLQYVEFDREPRLRFYLPRREVLLPVVNALQDIEDNKLDFVSVSQPPGTGKTTLGIFFLTWVMGKYPNMPNLASAHSSKLTRSFYDGVCSIITDPEYLWADVFPNVHLVGTNAKDETIDLDKPKRFKSLTCRSIDGSLTGATRCEKILYADDLVSGIEEALSYDRLESLWSKYVNDLKTRKKMGCKEVHIATGWSVHDVIGRLQQQYGDDPRYRFIELSALNDNQESNFSYKYGVGFSTKYFLDMKDSLDEVSWMCLFQNQRIEREGQVFSEDSLRRYYELPSDPPDVVIGVCDTAEGGGNDTVLLVGYMYGKDVYIEDCVVSNALPEVTDGLCADVLLRNKVKQCRFESNSAGGRTADKVNELLQAKGGATHITKKRTISNKQTRIIVNSDYVKNHFLFKDKSKCSGQYAAMIRKLCVYSALAKNKQDDVPDAMAQMVDYIHSMDGGKVEIFRRPW